MATAMATREQAGSAAEVMEAVISAGDLERLTPDQRTRYYLEVCGSIGLNPLTQPFQYIRLNNRLTLYATKSATDQIRSLRGISVSVVSQESIGDLYVVTVEGRDASGRTDTEVGVVTMAGLRGDNAANAIMKAVTKAKRRLTLSMAGLGLLDESELETTPAVRVTVDAATGEILTPEAPAIPSSTPPASTANATGPTRNQLGAIAGIGRNLGMSPDDLRGLAHDRYGVTSSTELTKAQASDFIDHLKILQEDAIPSDPPVESVPSEPNF